MADCEREEWMDKLPPILRDMFDPYRMVREAENCLDVSQRESPLPRPVRREALGRYQIMHRYAKAGA